VLRPRGRADSAWLTRHRILAATILLAIAGVAATSRTVWQADHVSDLLTQLRSDGQRLQAQLRGSDLTGAALTTRRLRETADRARSMTSGPGWAVAGVIPGIGRDVQAVRAATTGISEILDAAEPLESELPRLDPRAQRAAGGRIDVEALARAAATLPAISHAVNVAHTRLQLVDPLPLQASVGDGVRALQSALGQLRGPLDGAATVLDVVPTMLGATGPQNYVVLLQQDAEARGTGGLVGSFAVVRASQGQLTLLQAQSRTVLQNGTPIPSTSLPEGLQALWGKDLTEWAGLNLSPHFPWTGQLVAAGWAAQHRTPEVDYVVGMDEYVVAALLAGTGPVTVDGITLTSANAPTVLSRDIYARFSDPARIDRVAAGLVQEVFGRISTGRFSLAPIVTAMTEPVQQRRLTIWAADRAVQSRLETLTIGGALPDTAGPFAMAVVNNGGGNKLDAYLKVDTTYDPGPCDQNVRLGHITVTLTNTAPRKGLPSYVSVRTDLADQHKPNPVVGSNRLILDVYGPVGASSPLVTLDDNGIPMTVGLDRNHPVWRVVVPIDPGQTRTVDVLVLQSVTSVSVDSPRPVVFTQPMAIPATSRATPRVSSCAAS
jgi:hypothetical protein